MKTKHHLIVALMNAGIEEDLATTIASTCFNSENPHASFSEEHKAAKTRLEIAQREYGAIDLALTHWVGGDAEKPYANSSDESRLRS